MIAYMVKQMGPEWWELRAGKPTASDFDKILTGRGKPSAQAAAYMKQLARDRVTPIVGAVTEHGRPGTPAMQAGRDAEPQARKFYAMERNVTVHEVGFIPSPCGRYGGSPDGLVNPRSTRKGRDSLGRLYAEYVADGGVEIKCPLPTTQAKWLKKDTEVPTEYRAQVHGHLVITGLPWWDFLSYVPDYDPLLVRVYPDEYTKQLADALAGFCDILETFTLQEAEEPIPA